MPARAIKNAEVPITPAAMIPLLAPLLFVEVPVAAAEVAADVEVESVDVAVISNAAFIDEKLVVVAELDELKLELVEVDTTVVVMGVKVIPVNTTCRNRSVG